MEDNFRFTVLALERESDLELALPNGKFSLVQPLNFKPGDVLTYFEEVREIKRGVR